MSSGFACQLEAWTSECLRSETDRGLSGRSLRELHHYLRELVHDVSRSGVSCVQQLSPSYLTTFLLSKADGSNAALVKAYVWALRKLGGFLALRQIAADNPARHLRHPKLSRRARLPEHLTAEQLRVLLESTARTRCLMDFCVVSLLATTGLRPHEVAVLKRDDVLLGRQLLLVKVKGGWLKRTPISDRMAQLLQAWFAARSDTCEAAFVTPRGQPLYAGWILYMVREAGRVAQLPFRLTPRHLRHSFATFAVDRHGITVTRALLGHATPQHTAVYTHCAPSKFRRIMLAHPYQTTPERGGHR